MEIYKLIIFLVLIFGLIYSINQIRLCNINIKRNDWVYQQRMKILKNGLDDINDVHMYNHQQAVNLIRYSNLQSYSWMMENKHITDINECFRERK